MRVACMCMFRGSVKEANKADVVGRGLVLAFLSCECMSFRARVLGAPCDPTHAFDACRFLVITSDCNKLHSN